MNLSETAELLVISIASKTTYGGAAAGLVGWWTKMDWLSLIGTVIAVLSFVANLYYRHRRDKREQEEHVLKMEKTTLEYQMRMDLLQQGVDPDAKETKTS